MKKATAHLKSVSPYSQSRFHNIKKKADETSDTHEERTWRERLSTTKDGNVFIPPMAFKNCLSSAAKYLKKGIPGQGKSTYTKKFVSGVLVADGLTLPVKKDQVQGESFFVPADGIRGSGKRVMKTFPVIPDWSGKVEFTILDEIIDKNTFTETLEEAGKFIGIGRFRPENNGFYGRFTVEKVDWQ